MIIIYRINSTYVIFILELKLCPHTLTSVVHCIVKQRSCAVSVTFIICASKPAKDLWILWQQ